ncbi:hypothetical protein [Sphingobacterium multivorum]|uniref:hypothetical protein n=1 Tax=Sphingobacterium multivorum TaxID=28454 RepID=UPI0031BA8523
MLRTILIQLTMLVIFHAGAQQFPDFKKTAIFRNGKNITIEVYVFLDRSQSTWRIPVSNKLKSYPEVEYNASPLFFGQL